MKYILLLLVALAAGWSSDLHSSSMFEGVVLPLLATVIGLYLVIKLLLRFPSTVGFSDGGGGDLGGDGGC